MSTNDLIAATSEVEVVKPLDLSPEFRQLLLEELANMARGADAELASVAAIAINKFKAELH